ncbi:protein of unknown function [Thermococcus nautili]|nr:protein of unknown function [Thermococcus nautili]
MRRNAAARVPRVTSPPDGRGIVTTGDLSKKAVKIFRQPFKSPGEP